MHTSSSTPHTTPWVVFVDGPNGVGKDYFLSQLSALYQETYPDRKFSMARATDFTKSQRLLRDKVFSGSELTQLFLGHLDLLNHITHTLRHAKPDVVFVNRSFASFLTYNIPRHLEVAHPTLKESAKERLLGLPSRRTQYIHSLRLRQRFLETYVTTFRNLFRNVPTLYIGLEFDPDLERSVVESVHRIALRDRQDGKPVSIDAAHIRNTVTGYASLEPRYFSAYEDHVFLDSGDAKWVMNQYFDADFELSPPAEVF